MCVGLRLEGDIRLSASSHLRLRLLAATIDTCIQQAMNTQAGFLNETKVAEVWFKIIQYRMRVGSPVLMFETRDK